jgi:hypothetical protein
MNQATITLDQFRALMLAAGYDEVLERKWDPSTAAGATYWVARKNGGAAPGP